MEVFVVKTGAANLASVVAAFDKLRVTVKWVESPADITDAGYLVLPGVGAFGGAMQTLGQENFVEPIRRRFEAGKPMLGICLGFQILFKESAESPGSQGLELFSQRIERFSNDVRVPHFGWNEVSPQAGCRYLKKGYAYFANSYRLREKPAGVQAAMTDYDGSFVCAIERAGLLACQFHPELSGEYGLNLLRTWLEENA